MRRHAIARDVFPRSVDQPSDGRARSVSGASPADWRRQFSRLGADGAAPSAIYARPDVYDLEHEGASKDDVRFFARLLARIRPRHVLELACGSGRMTFVLAAALPMVEIVGVDVSREMLARAATRRAAAPRPVRERVTLVHGDMRDWSGMGRSFDAVVIGCCSVSHLLTLGDRRRTWSNAFRLLRPGGLLILDVRMPDLATLAESQRLQPRAHVDLDVDAARERAPGTARLLRSSATTYEPHLQRADVRLLYDRFDRGRLAERFVSDFASHVYFPSELELLFLSTGFEIVRQYGDYSLTPVDRTSSFVVTVARRPRRPARQSRESGLLRAFSVEASATA